MDTNEEENHLKKLQIEETELKISKLQKDNRLAEYQLSRKYTNIELIKVFGSIVAVLLTIPTIIFFNISVVRR